MSAKNRKIQRRLEKEIIKNRRISELKKMSLGWYEGNRIIQTTYEPVELTEGFISKLHQPIVQFGKTEISTKAFTEAVRNLGDDKTIGFVDMSKMADETYNTSLDSFRKSVEDVTNLLMIPKNVIENEKS